MRDITASDLGRPEIRLRSDVSGDADCQSAKGAAAVARKLGSGSMTGPSIAGSVGHCTDGLPIWPGRGDVCRPRSSTAREVRSSACGRAPSCMFYRSGVETQPRRRPLIARIVRYTATRKRPAPRGLAGSSAVSSSSSRRFPVAVSRLPVIRCQVCQRTIACRSGQASAVLTEHLRDEHPDVLDASAHRPG